MSILVVIWTEVDTNCELASSLQSLEYLSLINRQDLGAIDLDFKGGRRDRSLQEYVHMSLLSRYTNLTSGSRDLGSVDHIVHKPNNINTL